MKWLRRFFKHQEPHFVKGGRFEKLFPLFEATHSFLFGNSSVTKKGPHVRDNLDTKRYMIMVVVALLPCILFGIYNAGYHSHKAAGLDLGMLSVFMTGLRIVLPIFIVTFLVGGLWEVLFSILRKHEINEGFLVTGMLFPLTLPPTIPLWMVAVGITFGVVIGKEVFGGTGRNFLNPALTGRAFLFFAYPAHMSGDAVWASLSLVKDKVADAFSGATPLAVASLTSPNQNITDELINAGYTLRDLFWGLIPGSIGETAVWACLLGAGLLILTGIGSWRTMAACVIGGWGMAWLFNSIAGSQTPPLFSLGPLWHLCMGGFVFGTVFMATDPVSSPSLPESQWIYGILIGAMTVLIRTINPAYPEGMMLAILIMNVFAPVIDHMLLQNRLRKRIPNVL